MPHLRRSPRLRRHSDPIVSLLTDFGRGDGFVGQVKAVILSIAPGARLIDLSHEAPPQDVRAGALILETAYAVFPRGTVHLCVIDPGVGSSRLPIVAQTAFALFVAPDNGLLTPIFERRPETIVRAIEHPLLHRPTCSATFHGRDLFAVAAARLAAGFPFARVGPIVENPVRLNMSRPLLSDDCLRGEVIAVDHFGNAATNITVEDMQKFFRTSITQDGGLGATEVFCGDVGFGALQEYYAQVAPGERLALINSAGRLELAINCGRLDVMGIAVGDVVEVKVT